jgi:hypothetical protein
MGLPRRVVWPSPVGCLLAAAGFAYLAAHVALALVRAW